MILNRQVGRAVALSSLEREVRGSNFGPVNSNTVSPTTRHRCEISSKEAVLPAGAIDGDGPPKLVTRFGVIQRV